MRALLGSFDRNLDNVDAKQCGSVVAGRFVEAAFHLLLLAHAGDARVVDEDFAVFARACDDRMRVRAATGLDRAHLHRPCKVADIQDAKPAEPLGADVVLHTFEPAVDPSPGLFHRHDQQVADDGDIALTAWTDH